MKLDTASAIDAAGQSSPLTTASRTSTKHVQDLSDDDLDRLAAEMEDPGQWGEVEEVGPGFYRAPTLAADLASALIAYRTEHHLTQQQLGQKLMLHESLVARLEAGQDTPTIDMLVRIAQHLGMSFGIHITPTRASLAAEGGEQADMTGAGDART